MDKQLLTMTQEQIQLEYASAYLYLSMADWLHSQDLSGVANWLYIQYKEEIYHAEGFVKFLQRLGQPINLRKIDQPKQEFAGVEEVFELALEHEQMISKSIRKMAKRAVEADEFEMREFLNWYIMEQVEEEETAEDILVDIRLVKDDPAGLYKLDKELANRSFAPDVIPYT